MRLLRWLLPRLVSLSYVVAAILLPGSSSAAPKRVPLPSDRSISVYVGVQARWDRYNTNSPATYREIPADVFAYGVAEIPTWENLDAHVLSLPPMPTDPTWLRYLPVDDQFCLVVDIADVRGRLNRLVVSEMSTHIAFLSGRARNGRHVIHFALKRGWRHEIYCIDGYSRDGAHLFRVAATNGQPDAMRYFAVPGYFTPKRPEPFLWRKCPLGHDLLGDVGDTYSIHGITVYGKSVGDSQGCSVGRVANNSQMVRVLLPLGEFEDLYTAMLIWDEGTTSLYPLDETEPGSENTYISGPLSRYRIFLKTLSLPPYSAGTAHWCVRLKGEHQSVYAIPYTVAKHRDIASRLRASVRSVASGVACPLWRFAWETMQAFRQWLKTDEGRRSGFMEEMLDNASSTDVVKATVVYAAMTDVVPLRQTVRVRLSPDIPAGGALVRATFQYERAWCDGLVPISQAPIVVRLAPPSYTSCVSLPMGHVWKVSTTLDPQPRDAMSDWSLPRIATPGLSNLILQPVLGGGMR